MIISKKKIKRNHLIRKNWDHNDREICKRIDEDVDYHNKFEHGVYE